MPYATSKQPGYFSLLFLFNMKILGEWYWIMPNMVLYSKELTDKQKLLFCVISSLCAEKWYCRATNEYLWELLNADERTIRRNVSALQEKWFIWISVKDNNTRHITLEEEDMDVLGGRTKMSRGVGQKCPHNNIIYNNTNNNIYPFETFWKDYPHARKWKKKDSEQFFKQQNSEDVKKQVSILKRKIKAWLQDAKYIPACERRIRDFVPLSDDVVKQDVSRIVKWHLNAWWDIKQRAIELKETFWEELVNQSVKELQKNRVNLTFN